MLAYPIIKNVKRKRAQIFAFSLSGFSCIAYVYAKDVILRYVLIFMIKSGIAMSFCLIYVITTETYPT